MTDTRTDPQTTPDEVQAVLLDLLVGLVGREYVEEMEVGRTTRFEADLELESMEVAELAEQLMARYGDRVDFVAWFADMELEQIIELDVGAVVDFIVATLGGAAEAPEAPGAASPDLGSAAVAGQPDDSPDAHGGPAGGPDPVDPADPAAGAPVTPAGG
jgi:acyl carrier protein